MSLVVPEPVHDWTVTIGEWEFGIAEFDPSIIPTTNIYYGRDLIETNLSAYALLAIALATATTCFLLIGFLLTKLTSDKPAPT